jgi:Domain of unknown function (DUF4267)
MSQLEGRVEMIDGQMRKMESPVSITSLSGLLTIFVALGIIFIGVREFFYPSVAARGFGVPLLDPGDGDFVAIKAGRDIASGILALTFLGLRNRTVLACAMAVLTLIPVFDGLIVLRHAVWTFTPIILIHWGTAVLMLVVVELLRRGK